jgi:hypothetical protein
MGRVLEKGPGAKFVNGLARVGLERLKMMTTVAAGLRDALILRVVG